jgi:hypothetical protein
MTRKPFPILIGAAMLMIATQALAQDAPTRILKKANLRALSSSSFGTVVTTSFVNLFTPTLITCVSSSSCTLHIEVSSEFSALDAGASLRMRVLVGDVVASPGLVTVATNNGAAATSRNGQTFQFMMIGVVPGDHMVKWQAEVSSGSALVRDRLQKINVYTP